MHDLTDVMREMNGTYAAYENCMHESTSGLDPHCEGGL